MSYDPFDSLDVKPEYVSLHKTQHKRMYNKSIFAAFDNVWFHNTYRWSNSNSNHMHPSLRSLLASCLFIAIEAIYTNSEYLIQL